MRNAFVEALVERAEVDQSIVLLTGDLGFTVLEPFADRFPERFFNVGVAEQNMVGLATGLATRGYVPFVYSIATFASMRAYEFIRNGPVLHNLPVRIVGVGGGVDYGTNGPTHHALEDVALMRVQPGLTVVAPADRDQARSATHALSEVDGPVYLRLGKGGAPVPGLDGRFEVGRMETIGVGSDVAILTYGSGASEAVSAARLLEQKGLGVTVAVVACLSPAPLRQLSDLLGSVDLAITLESHYRTGGLGSLVCEIVAEQGLDCQVERRGVTETTRGQGGDTRWLMQQHGLTARIVADHALRMLEMQP